MRPQTQALIDKLRGMKTLAEPGTAEEVIWDIAWTQLYTKHQEARLAKIAARLVHAWVSLRGDEDIYGIPNPPTIITVDQDQLRGLPPGTYTISEAVREELEHQLKEAPPEGPVVNLEGFLNDKELKRSINLAIASHYPKYKNLLVVCECGKEFAADEEWGNHVRVRIWRELKNQFPPIGEATPGWPPQDT